MPGEIDFEAEARRLCECHDSCNGSLFEKPSCERDSIEWFLRRGAELQRDRNVKVLSLERDNWYRVGTVDPPPYMLRELALAKAEILSWIVERFEGEKMVVEHGAALADTAPAPETTG